jgi:hypothetical protein
LLPVLKVRGNVDSLEPWHDTELKPGERWDEEIRAALQRMDIFLCLVSYQFLASQYIREVELKLAEERYARGEIDVVPVLLYPTDLEHDCTFLHQFAPLPAWQKSWREYEQGGDWNDALYPIGNGLKQAIENARARLKKKREPSASDAK